MSYIQVWGIIGNISLTLCDRGSEIYVVSGGVFKTYFLKSLKNFLKIGIFGKSRFFEGLKRGRGFLTPKMVICILNYYFWRLLRSKKWFQQDKLQIFRYWKNFKIKNHQKLFHIGLSSFLHRRHKKPNQCFISYFLFSNSYIQVLYIFGILITGPMHSITKKK